jgi:hypothetical protein
VPEQTRVNIQTIEAGSRPDPDRSILNQEGKNAIVTETRRVLWIVLVLRKTGIQCTHPTQTVVGPNPEGAIVPLSNRPHHIVRNRGIPGGFMSFVRKSPLNVSDVEQIHPRTPESYSKDAGAIEEKSTDLV